jgi:hypothetical protein
LQPTQLLHRYDSGRTCTASLRSSRRRAQQVSLLCTGLPSPVLRTREQTHRTRQRRPRDLLSRFGVPLQGGLHAAAGSRQETPELLPHEDRRSNARCYCAVQRLDSVERHSHLCMCIHSSRSINNQLTLWSTVRRPSLRSPTPAKSRTQKARPPVRRACQHHLDLCSLCILPHPSFRLQSTCALPRTHHSQPRYVQAQWYHAGRDDGWWLRTVVRSLCGNGGTLGESNLPLSPFFRPNTDINGRMTFPVPERYVDKMK